MPIDINELVWNPELRTKYNKSIRLSALEIEEHEKDLEN
jgi:hypothetical protein